MLPVEALKAALAQGPPVQDGLDGPCVLDLCAAPGSKATQLGTWLDGRGVLVANEPDAKRAGVLRANLIRAGVDGFLLTRSEGQELGSSAPELFDAVLVDVPCSSSGTVRKSPEVLDRWRDPGTLERKVNSRVALQHGLLKSGWRALRPGGVLVYSTCTFNPKESEEQCQWLLQAAQSARPVHLGDLLGLSPIASDEGALRVWPQTLDGEGFFVACFRKDAAADRAGSALPLTGEFPRRIGGLALRRLQDAESEQLRSEAEGQLGWWPARAGALAEDHSGTVWSLPRAAPALEALASLAFSPGVRVGRRAVDGRLEFSRELLLLAGDRAVEQARGVSNESWIESFAEAGGGVGASTMSMQGCAAEGDVDGAEGVLARMQGERMDPTIVSYTLLMKTHVKAKKLGRARKLLTDLQQQSVDIDLVCYSTLLDAYASAGDVSGAEGVLAQIERQNLRPNLAVRNMLLKAHAKAGTSPRHLERLLEEMRAEQLAPDLVSYTTLIGAHARRGDVAAAERVLSDIETAQLEPNLFSFNTVLRSCVAAADAQAAERIFEDLCRRLRPNVFTYTFLMEAHAKAGNIQRAEEVLEEAWRDGLEPSMRSYNILLKDRGGSGDPEGVRRVLTSAKRRGLKPDLVSWTLVIGAYARQGHIGAAEDAQEEMNRQRIVPDLVCYNTLVSMYQRRNLYTASSALLEEMRERRLRTDPWTFEDNRRRSRTSGSRPAHRQSS